MRPKIAFANAGWMMATLLLFTTVSARAEAGDMKIEAQLIWATNDKSDPDPKHKPVSSDVEEKLKQLPLKWSNYFEVNHVPVEIAKGKTGKAKLSSKCEVEIKNVDGGNIEVALISSKGDSVPVLKRIQPLPKGDILILGGNAPNSTAWLVALKRIK